MKFIIVGAYAIGTHLAKLLSRNNQDTVLIDSDEERLAAISSDYDLMTVLASASKIQTLKDAGVSGADLFIAVTPDENLNMNACMLAKAMGAKFSFGTNNFDPAPKDLTRWLDAITWLDLHGEDIWTPSCLAGK